MKKVSFVVFLGSLISLIAFIGCQNILQLLDVPVNGVTVTPTAQKIQVGQTVQLTALVQPSNATNKAVIWSSDNQSTATVTSTGIVRGAAVGTATITVTTADGAKTAFCAITVTQAVTGVKLSTASTSVVVNGTFQLVAILSPANVPATSQDVTWQSTDANTASVIGNGLVFGKAAGTAVIVVTTSDGRYSDFCTVTVSQNQVAVQGVSLNKTSATIDVGGTLQLSASITPSDATNQNLIWSTSDSNIASVSSAGLVSGVAAGNATITVTTEDGNFQATCVVTVTTTSVAVQGVTLNQTAKTIEVGGTYQLAATIAPANATNQNVTWKSSDPTIAMVSSSGLVTGITAGDAKVTVTTEDGNFQATCVVTVTATSVSVTGVEISQDFATVEVGGSVQLSATVLPTNATNQNVTWASSSPDIADVSSSGVVTGKADGIATITVTTTDGGFQAKCSVTVTSTTVPVTGVSLDKTALSLLEGGSYQLTATIAPPTATNQNVTWSTSDGTIASVNSTGFVTANAAGSATIKVTTADGGFSATCAVTVTQASKPVTGVTIAPKPLALDVGARSQLTAVISPTDATNQNVTWKSSDNTIATVSTSGLVAGVAAGTATITVTTEDGGLTDTCAVTVKAVQYNLTVQVGSAGGGTVSPSGTLAVNAGAATSIAATPSTGYAFSSWTVYKGSGVVFANPSSATTTVTLTTGAAIIQANFLQLVAAPTLSPGGGTYHPSGITNGVTITTTTTGATIYYTTNGTTPSATNGTKYAGTPVAVSGTMTLRAIAVMSGWHDSSVTSASYTLIDSFAYTAYSGSAAVWAYSVDAAYGYLRDVKGTPYKAANTPSAVIEVLAGGKLPVLYVANYGSSDISAYTVNLSTGALTAVSGSPFSMKATGPVALAADPKGRFLYSANAGSNDVSLFTIDVSTGALTLQSTMAVGTTPSSVTAHPKGFLYVTNMGSSNISAYTINGTTGALTAIKGSPFAVGKAPAESVIDPKGAYLYVANSGEGSVYSYKIDPTYGILSLAAKVAAGKSPVSVTTDSTGAYVYVADSTSKLYTNVLGFTSASGVLTAMKGSPFTSLASGAFSVRVGPSDKFLFVPNKESNVVSVFAINPRSGLITEIKGSPYKGATGPVSIAIVPAP